MRAGAIERGDLAAHTVGEAREHGVAAAEQHVAVEVPADIN
jgi:hypothetical protein